MKRTIGLILVLAGGAIMLYGMVTALSQLADLYGNTIADPLNEKASAEPKQVSESMWRSALIGVLGVPLFVVGIFMLNLSLLQRFRRDRD